MTEHVLIPRDKFEEVKRILSSCEKLFSGDLAVLNIPEHREKSIPVSKKDKEKPHKKTLADLLFEIVPDTSFTPKDAFGLLAGRYKFRGKTGRKLDSVRNALKTDDRFDKLSDGKFAKKK